MFRGKLQHSQESAESKCERADNDTAADNTNNAFAEFLLERRAK